jgi:predicted metal-dependent HD superfamily phosphohydrolase
MLMPEKTFKDLVQKYTNNSDLVAQLWEEIGGEYSAKGRHYHTLTHLQNLLDALNPVQNLISEADTMLFSVFYHDIVYNPLKQDNEARSAALAADRLTQLRVPPAQIAKCQAQIMATQGHTISADTDTNLFTDADLSILGQPREIYAAYAAQVRQEYAVFPDLLYKPGRRKVLNYFLQGESIYKSKPFYQGYEQQARANLSWELNQLNN